MKHLFFNITQIAFAIEGFILLTTPAWPIAYMIVLGALVLPQPSDKSGFHPSMTKIIINDMIFKHDNSVKDFFKREATTIGRFIMCISAVFITTAFMPVALIILLEFDILWYVWDSLAIADNNITPLINNVFNPITKILNMPVKL
jgi:hypothetical protein